MIKNLENLNEWNIKKIPDLLFFQEGPGVRNNQYTDSGIKLLNVANLQNGKVILDNTIRYISEDEGYGRYKHFLVDEGDLVIASSGIKVEYFEKKMGFVRNEHLPLCMNTSTIRFKTLNENELDIKYFSYFLKTNYFKRQISRLITGSAQLNFGPSHLNQIDVIVPPINIQKKIVEALNKDQSLIDKRKAQIDALDELIKSIFFDMFGDLAINDKGWKKEKLNNVVVVDTKMVKDFEFYKEYFHVGIENIEKNTGKLINMKKIKDLNLISGKYLFNNNHIIYSKIRPNLNKVALPDIEGLCSADAYPLLVNKDICNRVYIAYVLRSDCFLNYILSFSNRTNIPKVNKQQVLNFDCICPPIELQNKFAQIVETMEKQKELLQQSLTQLENNFNVIMQRAFKGELFD